MLTELWIIIAALTVTNTANGTKRPLPRVNSSSPCREPDGRIRIGCLPPETIRALPVAKAQVDASKRGSGPRRLKNKRVP